MAETSPFMFRWCVSECTGDVTVATEKYGFDGKGLFACFCCACQSNFQISCQYWNVSMWYGSGLPHCVIVPFVYARVFLRACRHCEWDCVCRCACHISITRRAGGATILTVCVCCRLTSAVC